MKNNIDFYQHYSNADQHPKFKMLRVKYGWEGEGKFWALNNRIALSENCMLDISKKYNVSSIAHDLSFSKKEFENYIDFLVDECELIIKRDVYITTDIVQENLNRVMKKRKKNKSDYGERLKESVSDTKLSESDIQTSENIQSKVKDSIVKERKGKDIGTKVPLCPHKKIIELYHEKLPMMPSVKVWDDPNRKNLKSRWCEDKERQTIKAWDNFFKYISESDFLVGNNDKNWQANLGWIVKKSNFDKIMNGNYHNDNNRNLEPYAQFIQEKMNE